MDLFREGSETLRDQTSHEKVMSELADACLALVQCQMGKYRASSIIECRVLCGIRSQFSLKRLARFYVFCFLMHSG